MRMCIDKQINPKAYIRTYNLTTFTSVCMQVPTSDRHIYTCHTYIEKLYIYIIQANINTHESTYTYIRTHTSTYYAFYFHILT